MTRILRRQRIGLKGKALPAAMLMASMLPVLALLQAPSSNACCSHRWLRLRFSPA